MFLQYRLMPSLGKATSLPGRDELPSNGWFVHWRTSLTATTGHSHPARLLIKELDIIPDLGNSAELARLRVLL